MNTLQKVLIGAVALIAIAGLVVGLSIEVQLHSQGSALGEAAQTHNFTNFGASYVSSKVGFGITANDTSGITPFVISASVQGNPTVPAPYPLILAGNITNSANGFTTVSTSTTLSPQQFLGAGNFQIINTTGNTTTTFPSATSTYQVAGNPNLGGFQLQLVTNDSTNTATFVAGPGMIFKCETQGVGTTTVLGTCTSSQVTVNATSTALATGYWDTSSSTFDVLWGNEWH